MSIPASPLSVYLRNLENGELRQDQQQRRAIQKLDSLYFRVISPTHESGWYKPDWFAKLCSASSAQTPRGIYLWGGVGTGKTRLMDMFYQCLPKRQARRIHFYRFMQFAHDQKNRIQDQHNPLAIIARKISSESKILCLDEFSVTDIADAMILSGLLNHLFHQGVVLVTTSNVEIDNLYKHGLQRNRFLPAIELLKRRMISVQVDNGRDYRMACLQDDAIFHTPLGGQANLQLTNCFNQLAGRYDKTIRSIAVYGRNIDVVASGPGIVWFEFKSLCQTSRSKTDYIEIARQFHTIFVSNIPPLDSTRDDAARRFIELVDEMYDRNVNMIVSSAQTPQNIYRGKRLAAPFKRTSSRLTEMSTPPYLARPHLG